MTDELVLLSLTAASIGFLHTILGPDHYVPFIALASARRWSSRRTIVVTLTCGVGHVLSSVVISVIGIGLGLTVSRLEAVDSVRGSLAAWLLITFGFLYLVWGLRQAAGARRGAPRAHDHEHGAVGGGAGSPTTWMLFIVFVLGPCEALIPVLIYPAAVHGMAEMVAVTVVFGVTTLATMVGVVFLGLKGVSMIRLSKLERFSHALAGAAILLCGLGIQLLGF